MTFTNGSIALSEAAADLRAECPDCGGELAIDVNAETETAVFRQAPGRMSFLEMVRRPAVVAFCNGCEYAHELQVQR